MTTSDLIQFDLRSERHEGLCVTNVTIVLSDDDRGRATKVLGYATVVLNNAFKINNIRILENDGRVWLAMPSVQRFEGYYFDLAHPITNDAREWLSESIMSSYRRALEISRAGHRERIAQ